MRKEASINLDIQTLAMKKPSEEEEKAKSLINRQECLHQSLGNGL